MPIKLQLMNSLRAILRAKGYELLKKEYSPFGCDVMLDIGRLSRMWNYPASICFDVGANVGQTAVRFLKEFPEAWVFSFEPHPETFNALKMNMCNVKTFRPFNLALGTTVGEVDLFEYEESQLSSLVQNAPYAVHRQNHPKARLTVSSTTVDRFCFEQNLERVDILKIDTEGFDFQVLQGASDLLSRGKIAFVYMEFNSIHPQAGTIGSALAPIDSFLYPYGYRFVATYTDRVSADNRFFLGSNALFALPPG